MADKTPEQIWRDYGSPLDGPVLDGALDEIEAAWGIDGRLMVLLTIMSVMLG